MRRYSLAVFIVFTVFNFSVYAQSNQDKLLRALLNLPAPPPFEAVAIKVDNTPEFPAEFFSKNKVPADNAPIEEIMAYWARNNDLTRATTYSIKPTEIVAARIFGEIEDKPDLLTNYLNILPPEKDYIEFIKQVYDENLAEIERQSMVEAEEKPLTTISDAIAAAEKISNVADTEVDENMNSYKLEQIKEWLTNNSRYFSDELAKKAERIKDADDYVSTSKEELVALAKVDWEKAEPIIERLLADKNSQPASASTALWAAYGHYMFAKDERGAEKYRRMLQDVVENRKAAAGVRDIALDALTLEGEFEGREDWYISLLEDETLYELGGYTGLTTLINTSPPEKWIPKMIPLIGNKNVAVHDAAVRNLVILLGRTDDENDKLILKALIPWLTNTAWAKDNSNKRGELIKEYGRLKMSEVIPALIQILQTEKPTAETRSNYSDRMSYVGNMNVGIPNSNAMKDDMLDAMMKGDSLTEGLSNSQTAAVDALSKFKDARAVPALLGALEQIESVYQRREIISAIIASGGYTANQQLNFIEKLARKIISANTDISNEDFYYNYEKESYDLDEQTGLVLITSDEPEDELVSLTLARIKDLKKSDPKVADILEHFLQKWKSRVLDLERLNAISANTADIKIIIKALADRKNLRQKYPNQISAMRGSGGIAGGLAACFYDDVSEVLTAANSGDMNTKIAALGCARLLRIKLPLPIVGQLMNNQNKTLALAAERYLISEDSKEARTMVLGKHAGEAEILGARFAFVPEKKDKFEQTLLYELFNSVNGNVYFYDPPMADLDKTQEKLREEIKANDELLGVYGFLQDATSGHKILRIYKDKAVYAWYEDDARYRERIVKPDELKLIFDYVAVKQIEELKPIIGSCHHDCPSEEFVMFGRNGGRRVYIYTGEYFPQPLYGLKMIFEVLEQGESTLHYWLQDKIAGLEIILDEKNVKAKSLWKDGDDFRVLVIDEKQQTQIYEEIERKANEARSSLNIDNFEDASEYYNRYSVINSEIQQQRAERKFEPYVWRNVRDKKLGDKISQPAEDHSISENGQFPEVAELETPESIWKARTSEFELRKGNYQKAGLWKIARNGLVTPVAENDNYTNSAVVSADGKWAVIGKNSDDYYITEIYRINLRTGKEHKIELPKSPLAKPVAYIQSLNKFLVFSSGFEDVSEYPEYIIKELNARFAKGDLNNKPAYYLLDADTGSLKAVTGEFAPFEQITFRNLQKTSNVNEFWAAIPNAKSRDTKIGRYDAKTFKFTEVMKVPEIKLTSMDIWIDEKDAKLYFIYEGNLLGLPFKKTEQPTN